MWLHGEGEKKLRERKWVSERESETEKKKGRESGMLRDVN